MNCTMCGYAWCWVCGYDLNHWIHRVPSLFGCNSNRVPSGTKGTLCFLLLFIVGLLFMPLIIFFGCFFGLIYLSSLCVGSCICNNSAACLICCPLYSALFIVMIGVSFAGAAVGLAIFIIPAYVFHIYSFCRTIYWWRKSRVDKGEIKVSV
jgi:hypothetical protein